MTSTGDRRNAKARDTVCSLTSSRIREIANAGFGNPDVLRLWFGESDQPTPAFIRDAGIQALAEGKTFYAHNQGVAELREGLSSYLGRLHDRTFDAERISVTSSGVSALMLAAQAILEPGDRVVIVTPVWPNVTEIPRILSAQVVRVALAPVAGEWRLDMNQLLDAITPDTRLVIVNSPGNPTGWTLSSAQQAALLEHCRRIGAWLLADDVYERLILDESYSVAPSFMALADPRGSSDQRQQFLEGLAHDRLASRLARHARRAVCRSRQAPRVQHVMCARVRASGRHRRVERRGSACREVAQ